MPHRTFLPAAAVRPYTDRDRAAVREICRQAAHEQPDPLLQEDDELAPVLLVDYYLDADPDCCFVAVVDQRVVGYIVGCKSTEAYLKALQWRIFPRAALRILLNIMTLRYRRLVTYRALWWHLFVRLSLRRSLTLPRPLVTHPAHAHFNVERRCRGQGIGQALSIALHDHLRACGIKGLHAIVVERADNDSTSRFLCARRGHVILATRPHEVLRRVTGQEYHLKLLACDLEREAANAQAQSVGEGGIGRGENLLPGHLGSVRVP
jgi:ribosomal protein S18 acetylase RimI-like enzyme